MNPRLREPRPDAIERKVSYMADYVTETVHVEGKKKPKRVLRYVGPYFAFEYPDEQMALWKKIYFYGFLVMVVLIAFPLFVHCNIVNAWYVAIGEVVAIVALAFGVPLTWMLFRSGDTLKRRDNDQLDARIPLTTVFSAIGFFIVAGGSVVYMITEKVANVWDVLTVIGSVLGCGIAMFLFLKNSMLDTYQVDAP